MQQWLERPQDQQQVQEMKEDERIEEAVAVQELGFALFPGVTEESYMERRVPYLFVMGMTKEAQEVLPVRLKWGVCLK